MLTDATGHRMNAIAPILIAASGAIFLVLGFIHLAITYAGPLLLPRDRELRRRMESVSLVISRETTMWKAWQGFNASHGLGAMLFGVVYVELALRDAAFLAHETVLQGLGLVWALAWVGLAFRHWFSVPQAGVTIAALLYAGGLIALHA